MIQELNVSAKLFKSIFSAMLPLGCHRVYDEMLLLCLWNVVKALFHLITHNLSFHLLSCFQMTTCMLSNQLLVSLLTTTLPNNILC